jgi:glyoxylase-like metal-dependent hydrolase (beta-lactamase superfamily II)
MATEILDGVYDLTLAEGVGRIRVYLFDGETPTLVDAGYADTTEALLAGIEEVGITPERLILTHGDPDHVGGFDALVEEYGVETWVPVGVDLDTEHGPDHRYGDGESIGPFETVRVPGHAPGSSALVDEGRGILVTGDTVFGSDMRGLPAGSLIAPSDHFSEDVAQADRNLEELLSYDFDVALVFHGSSVMSGAKGKLDAYVNFPGT